jgi:integrase
MNTQLDVNDGYIPETDGFLQLKSYFVDNCPKTISLASLAMATDLLKQILFRMYKATDYGLLVKRSTSHLDECQLFSKHMAESLNDSGWALSTSRNISSLLKRLMRLTALPLSFIDKIRHTQTFIRQKEVCASDAKWIDIIKRTTNNRSDAGISNIIRFCKKMMPRLGIENDTIDADEKAYLAIKIDADFVKQLELSQNQLRWLKILLKNILEVDVPDHVFKQFIIKKDKIIEDDGSDKHRLSATELDTLYTQVKGNLRDELMYMLFVTTGMRIGGLVKIKLDHVAEISGNTVVVKQTGRTLEKGNKWFTFMINNHVNALIESWIKTKRPNNGSVYLFPGRGEIPYIREASVRKAFHKWCEMAGMKGTHLHPHSLRHSYGHLLIKAGNNIHDVSKLMGHSNIATTEIFYLRESSADVAKRANIPWLQKPEQEEMMPKFLTTKTAKDKTCDKERQDRERKKRMKNMAKVGGFTIKNQLNKINE